MSIRAMFVTVALACATCATFTVSAADAPEKKEEAPEIKGEKVTLKGEIIDVWCYMEGGDHGKDHKDCGVACIKAGNPIGLLDDKGNVYILMGGKKDHQPGKDMLIDKVSETVTIEGTLVTKGGTKVVFVTTVK